MTAFVEYPRAKHRQQNKKTDKRLKVKGNIYFKNAVFVFIDNLNLDSSLIMNPGDLPLLSR